ncbi:MAG: NAD-dependent deacylase [Pseudomonadota bacterium]
MNGINQLNHESLARARSEIFQADGIAVLTGAGISAESGVPTFRGPGGLWNNYRAEELATPEAFRRDPRLVWEWYQWRRNLMAEKKPNPGHLALAELEERTPDFTLITQNVDGLHALAGSRNILELHGSIWRTRCVSCGGKAAGREPWPELPPRCPTCRGLVRPDVVWFGEALNEALLGRAFAAASACRVMLVVGTSALVQPAATVAWLAQKAGAVLIEVNVEPTPLSARAQFSLMGPSGRILPLLIEK